MPRTVIVVEHDKDALLERADDGIAPAASGDSGTLAELKARAIALREQAIELWSTFTRPAANEGLVRLVAQIVDEIECLKRLRSDAVPPEVRAGVAALAARVAAFEYLLRSRGPDGDGSLDEQRQRGS